MLYLLNIPNILGLSTGARRRQTNILGLSTGARRRQTNILGFSTGARRRQTNILGISTGARRRQTSILGISTGGKPRQTGFWGGFFRRWGLPLDELTALASFLQFLFQADATALGDIATGEDVRQGNT